MSMIPSDGSFAKTLRSKMWHVLEWKTQTWSCTLVLHFRIVRGRRVALDKASLNNIYIDPYPKCSPSYAIFALILKKIALRAGYILSNYSMARPPSSPITYYYAFLQPLPPPLCVITKWMPPC